jgi:hypothetical protein
MNPRRTFNTVDEIMEAICEISPGSEHYIDENSGQIIVHLGYAEDEDGTIFEIEELGEDDYEDDEEFEEERFEDD